MKWRCHLHTKFGGNLSTHSWVISNRGSPRPLPWVWPVYLTGENGKKFSRFWLHHVATRGGGGMLWVWLGLAQAPLPTKEFLPFLLFCFVLWSYMTSGSCYWCETFIITPPIYFMWPTCHGIANLANKCTLLAVSLKAIPFLPFFSFLFLLCSNSA